VERKEKKGRRMTIIMMMINGLLWAFLSLTIKEVGLREAVLDPSSLKKQRRSIQRLPCFLMSMVTGKGCLYRKHM
jgi:hypothetical protein